MQHSQKKQSTVDRTCRTGGSTWNTHT